MPSSSSSSSSESNSKGSMCLVGAIFNEKTMIRRGDDANKECTYNEDCCYCTGTSTSTSDTVEYGFCATKNTCRNYDDESLVEGFNFTCYDTNNICDDKPASQYEVAGYGAKLLKLKQPAPIKLEKIESEILKNFYKDSKKVDNKKMKAFFKYNLKFPTYIEGLAHIFNNSI